MLMNVILEIMCVTNEQSAITHMVLTHVSVVKAGAEMGILAKVSGKLILIALLVNYVYSLDLYLGKGQRRFSHVGEWSVLTSL